MHYPFYVKDYNTTKNIIYERQTYSFLNQTASAFMTFFPTSCLRASNKRRVIGIFPRDEVTSMFREQLNAWSKFKL